MNPTGFAEFFQFFEQVLSRPKSNLSNESGRTNQLNETHLRISS